MKENLKAIGRAISKRKINLAVAVGINILNLVPLEAVIPDTIGIGVIKPDSSGWYLSTSNSSTEGRWRIGLEWQDYSPEEKALKASTLSHTLIIGVSAEGFIYENTIERIPLYVEPSTTMQIVHSP